MCVCSNKICCNNIKFTTYDHMCGRIRTYSVNNSIKLFSHDCLPTFIHTHLYEYACTYMCICVQKNSDLLIYVHIYIHICLSNQITAHTCTYLVNIRTYLFIYVHTCTHTVNLYSSVIYMYIHIYICTCMFIYVLTCTSLCSYMCKHLHIHTYIHIHIHIHLSVHTSTYIYMYIHVRF